MIYMKSTRKSVFFSFKLTTSLSGALRLETGKSTIIIIIIIITIIMAV